MDFELYYGPPQGQAWLLQTEKAIYEIPCKNCPKTYIGETGRLSKQDCLNINLKISTKIYTKAQRKSSTNETFKSTTTHSVTSS